jgi:quercetin dioxygenase-like cupin family protein
MRREDVMANSSAFGAALVALALLLPAGAAQANEKLDPAVLAYKLPDQLKWRDPTGAAGVNQAILQGDPTKPGLYVVLNRFKPGNFSRPHFHPNDRFITVVKGTWWIGTGNKFDPDNGTVPMPAGSFVTHFGKQVHYDGAKDEEAWVLIVGEGPATLTRVEEAK